MKPNLRSYPLFNPLQDKSKNIKFHLSAGFTKQIDDYCTADVIFPQRLFQFAVCTYLSKINNNAEDIFHMVLCARRTGLTAKTTCGCMVGGVTVRANINGKNNFRDALSQISTAVTQSYRHTHYSGVEATFAIQKIYKIPVFDHYVSFIMSYLDHIPLDEWDSDAEWISNGRFAIGLYCVIVHSPVDGGYDIYYEYRTKMLNADHITALHNGMTEILRLGIENPGAEISDIVSNVK